MKVLDMVGHVVSDAALSLEGLSLESLWGPAMTTLSLAQIWMLGGAVPVLGTRNTGKTQLP